MSNIAEQIVEYVVHPDLSYKDLAIVPVAIAGLYSYRKDLKGAMSTKPELAAHPGTVDDQLLDHQIINSETQEPATAKAYEKKQRVGARRRMTAGFVIFAASFLAHPTTEITTQTNSESVAVALDSSLSMDYTTDMTHNQSRFDSAREGLEDSSFSGNLAVVQFGANTQTAVTLGPKNNPLIESLTASDSGNVDENGADAVAGLSAAASLLPNQAANPKKRSGEVILISDGVLDATSDATQIQTEANTLHNEGVDVKVIVTGKDPANYNYGGAEFPSGIQSNIFSSFGSVITTQSAEGIAKAVQTDESKPSSSKHSENWYPPYLVGATLIYLGYRKYGRRVRKVTV